MARNSLRLVTPLHFLNTLAGKAAAFDLVGDGVEAAGGIGFAVIVIRVG